MTLNKNFKKENILLYFLIFIFSFVAYEGMLSTGDHAFVYAKAIELNETKDNLVDYLINVDIIFFHYFIWIIHDFLIINLVDLFLGPFGINNEFYSKYAVGWVLTFYYFIAVLEFYRMLIKWEIQRHLAILATISFFFSTSLIGYSTGDVSESAIILLFVLRLKFFNSKYIFLIDLLIIFMKPYYLIICAAIYVSEIKNINNLTLSNMLGLMRQREFKYILIITFFFILVKLPLIMSDNFQASFWHGFSTYYLIRNFFLIFVSPSFGIIFTFSCIFFFIFKGWNGNATLIKLISLVGLVFFLSFLPYWHGQMGGSRYLAPIFITFLPEVIYALKEIQKSVSKNDIIVVSIITILSIINIPSMEFRNTSIHEYAANTIVEKKTYAQRYGGIEGVDGNQYLYDFYDVRYHPTIFSLNVFISKTFDSHIYVDSKFNNIPKQNIYPMTGFGRILFVEKYKLNNLYKYPLILNGWHIKIIEYVYYIYYSFFLFIICFCSYRVIRLFYRKQGKLND